MSKRKPGMKGEREEVKRLGGGERREEKITKVRGEKGKIEKDEKGERKKER